MLHRKALSDNHQHSDIADLVGGTMKQQRLLATCPKAVTEDDLAGMFTRSIEQESAGDVR